MAQALNNQIKDVVMPSPNAASLGKYGDIPVSYHTGVPNVGIPIHTLQEGPISLPISLSYHAGGVKVGEPCSWVGLNWSLQAGGMISRTVQGRADESAGGYMSNGVILTTLGLGGTITPSELATGTKDGEPDIFSFSVGGYSGKFYIGVQSSAALTGTAIVIPKQDVKVEYFLTSGFGANRLYKFKVTTPEGVIYEFGDTGAGAPTATPYIEYNQNSILGLTASGWYLKKITSPDLVSTIELSYTAEEYRQFSRKSPGSTNSSSSGGSLAVDYMDYKGWRLNTIITKSGTITSPEKVTFVPGANRQDIRQVNSSGTVNTGVESKTLSAIKIENGTMCKQFNLSQDYWLDNSVHAFTSSANGASTEANYRLRLNQVQEQSCSGTLTTIPATVFTYYNKSDSVNFLPNRYSPAVDHWGYYNGANGNPKGGFNIPYTRATYYKTQTASNVDEIMGSSNRETNETTMLFGTLQTITYPTSGTTTFEYEANDYYNPTGIKVLRDTANLTHFWDGGNCGINNTSTNNILKTFTQVELDNMFYKIDARKATRYTATCADPSPNYQIKVSFSSGAPACNSGNITPSSTILSGAGTSTIIYEIKTTTGKLKDLFTCLLPNTAYKFEIIGTNSAVNFTLQQEITVGTNTNQKVGGLRVKTVTSYDGVSTANNIVKTYNYKVDNTTPAQSSAVLYSKPQYLAIYDPTILVYSAGGVIKPAGYKFHLFTDYSLVPLGSFEGSTVGYSSVKECLSNGACTKYTYFQETIQDYVGTPVPPTKPRVDAGNLSTKLQINSVGTTVASETNTIYTTDAYASNVNTVTNTADKYFKAINHALVQDGPTVFFLQYDIKNKPYRLSQMVSALDGVSTTTSYTYDANFIPKRSETITNSNGATTTSTYYYATHVADNNLLLRNMIGFPVKVKQQTGTSVKWSRVRYKLYNTTQIEPEYLEECFDATETTWITRLLISTYSTHGMPTSILKNGFTAPETYTWDVTFPKLLKKKQFGNLTSTTSLLKWEVFYKTGTSLVEKTMDADSLIKTYDYDPLMRLITVKDRMTLTGTDVQATTNYTYQYKDGSNPLNFIKTSTTFAAATNTTPLSTKQFMDGLGRPVSSVREFYTPSNLHQKNNVTYDALGRQDKAYLPFEGATTNYEAAAGTVPSSYTTYEASPLSRPVRQYAEDSRYMETQYSSNAYGDFQLFSVVNNTDGSYSVTASGVPNAGLYFKTTVFNENYNGNVVDGNIGRTDIFKDKLGRVVLTRKYVKDANNIYQNVDTYNLYDDYNNLIMVIPPGAYLTSNAGPTLSLVFQYRYDARQRLIAKKVPNADWVYFYYDARDLLTLTQDGNMRSLAAGGNVNKFLGTQYNEIGQVVKTGWVTTPTPATAALTVTIADADKLTETQYYRNHTWVKHQAAKVLKKTGVVTEREFIWSYIERRTTTGYTGNPAWTGKQHLLSKTFVGATAQPDRPILDADVSGVNWTVSNYDGAQKPLLTLNYLFTNTNAQQVRQWQTFTYDNGQRLKSSNYMYALNGAAVTSPTDTLSQINYNVRNQVIEKNTGRKNGKYLQSTDFTYNDRGWLTSINSGFLPSAKDYPLFTSSVAANIVTNYATLATTGFLTPPVNGGENNPDLFKEIIRYDNPNLSYPNNSKTVTPQYNGNISQIEWQVAGREAQAYTFNYDNLERLTESNYTDIHDATWVAKGWASQYESDNKFKETMVYDERGNITTLQRNGRLTEVMPLSGPMVVQGIFNAIDNLTYTYDGTDKNKLLRVVDAQSYDKGFKSTSAANAGATHYAYDTNGNLTRDDNKGITGIAYNHLNLPQVITFTNNASAQPRRIEFIYDATGVKLRKTVFVNNVAIDTTHYVNGIEYKGAVLNRFPHSEGAVVRQGTTATFLHEYTIKDHLGNARVTYTDANANGIVDSSEIKQVNHYYGFGLNMEGNWNGAGGTNKYQYNGKEWNDDFGLGLNDYGARWYDAAIGRWTAVDPMAEKYMRWSPYHYVKDNPVKFIDPTGMASEAFTSIDQANRNSANQQAATDKYTSGTNLSEDRERYSSVTKKDIAGSYSAKGYENKVGKKIFGNSTQPDPIKGGAALSFGGRGMVAFGGASLNVTVVATLQDIAIYLTPGLSLGAGIGGNVGVSFSVYPFISSAGDLGGWGGSWGFFVGLVDYGVHGSLQSDGSLSPGVGSFNVPRVTVGGGAGGGGYMEFNYSFTLLNATKWKDIYQMLPSISLNTGISVQELNNTLATLRSYLSSNLIRP